MLAAIVVDIAFFVLCVGGGRDCDYDGEGGGGEEMVAVRLVVLVFILADAIVIVVCLARVIYGLPPLPPSSNGIVRLGTGRAVGEGVPVLEESELPTGYHEPI